MDHFFTIIGGMGSLATESFVRLINHRTPTHNDQDYLDYLVINHASIPDRSSYILDHSQPNPQDKLVNDVKKFSALKPDFFVLTCNTAHYFFDKMQAATTIPILNMPELTVADIQKTSPAATRIGILGTSGTLATGIYDKYLDVQGYDIVKPTADIQAATDSLIFDDIKGHGVVDAPKYHHILSRMHNELKCDVTILGCTELSLAQEQAPDHEVPVADAQSILANQTLNLALPVQKNIKKGV